MEKTLSLNLVVDKVYDYSTVIKKTEMEKCVKTPKLEIVLNKEKKYTTEEILRILSVIGYYKDGNDVDEKIEDYELMKLLYDRYNLSISQLEKKINIDLPFVSLIKGLNSNRINDELKFYLKLEKNSDLYKNIEKMNILISTEDEYNTDEKFLYEILSATEEDYNKKCIIELNEKIFKEEKMEELCY